MRVRLVRRPGQHGTREYIEQYGDRLICVRYRYDAAAGRRYKTIEIIVDEAPWAPLATPGAAIQPAEAPQRPEPRQLRPNTLVGVKGRQGDQRLRQAGGVWRWDMQLWLLTYEQATRLGLADRIVGMADGYNKPLTPLP
jgi:hypothetical protein